MPDKKAVPPTMDAYIAQFPPEVQKNMGKMRKLVHKLAPGVQEKMSWGMPTFALHGNLVHFAGAKSHLGFYPGASGVENFLPKLEAYKTSKGAIQFPYNKPVPWPLVEEIIRFRVKENTAEAEKPRKK